MGNALNPVPAIGMNLPQPQCQAEYLLFRHCKRPPGFVSSREGLGLIRRVVDLVQTALQFGIFMLQPNLYAAGFGAGIIWDETCYYAVERIKAVWSNFTTLQKICAVVASIVALPVVILTGYFLYAASAGSHFNHESGYD